MYDRSAVTSRDADVNGGEGFRARVLVVYRNILYIP